uniref:Transmembrane protein n=1 Tax=Phytophthora ramorum TaxID=164328 RepID=H3H561_PHYRM
MFTNSGGRKPMAPIHNVWTLDVGHVKILMVCQRLSTSSRSTPKSLSLALLKCFFLSLLSAAFRMLLLVYHAFFGAFLVCKLRPALRVLLLVYPLRFSTLLLRKLRPALRVLLTICPALFSAIVYTPAKRAKSTVAFTLPGVDLFVQIMPTFLLCDPVSLSYVLKLFGTELGSPG